jgi:Zn-dependent M16 (insulinase) family peptidase
MSTPPSFGAGSQYGRFLVERSRHVPELRCRLIELRHVPSGARVIHIENDDPENLFCLSFQTLPYSSNGIAHVLEHLVLCGSDKFPVRDPFFSMTRRSMNTFMNALTGTDFTCYPAASQIKQDFYNLLSVYLDAVFHPLLAPLSFAQEGHRFEFARRDDAHSPLTINGVVYNEMKGANVSPVRRLMKEMNAQLFPNTPYGFDSGGDPKNIPSLTLDEVINFHRTYYHPSRCLFFFYGNFPLAEHLDILEERVLGRAEALPPLPPIPRQTRLHKPVVQPLEYPLPKGENPDKKAYIAYGWLTTDITNIEECLALTLLDIILLETDASPLKYNLLKSGHCRQVSSACDTEMPQVPFVILLTGCDEEDFAPLTDVLRSSLEQVAREGLPADKVEHALHQLELAKSEIGNDHGPFGLSLYSRAGLLAHYGLDPMIGLEIHGLFQSFRETLAKNPYYFSQLIQKYFLNNPHAVRLVMSPSNTLDSEEKKAEEAHLQAIRSQLDVSRCQTIIAQADQLKAFQEAGQDLSCLPSLHLKDVPKECRRIHLSRGSMGAVEWFSHETFTNDLVYIDIVAPLPRLSFEDLWFVRLFNSLLPQLGCGNRTYQQTLEYLQAYTGGVSTSLSLNSQANDPLTIAPSICLKGRSLGRNVERLAEILNDFFLAPSFDDRERIQEILEKRYTDLENSLPQHALEYASSRAHAPLLDSHTISEAWYGLSYLQRLRDLVANYPQREDAFLQKMGQMKESLLGNAGVHIVIGGDPQNILTLQEQHLFGLADIPPKGFHPWQTPPMPLSPREDEAYIISSPVSFTTVATKTACYTHPDAPSLAVLAQLMNDTFLHRQLREYGGAYGGGASSSSMGSSFSFYSYNDPNLFATLEAYDMAVRHIEKGGFDETQLEEAKLGVLQNLDSPIAPGSRAEVAYSWFRQGKTETLRQAYRHGVFSATREEIRTLIPTYFSKGWSKNAFIAFAGSDLIEQDRSRFEQNGRPLHIFHT